MVVIKPENHHCHLWLGFHGSYARSRPNLPKPPFVVQQAGRAYVIEAATLFIRGYLSCVPHAGRGNVRCVLETEIPKNSSQMPIFC